MQDKLTVKLLQVETFLLVDKNGTERCRIEAAVGIHAPVVLQLFDSTGRPRVTLSVDLESASIQIEDQNGKNDIALNSSTLGNGISLKDVKGKTRMRIGGSENGDVNMNFYSEKGQLVSEFPCEKAGVQKPGD